LIKVVFSLYLQQNTTNKKEKTQKNESTEINMICCTD